MKSLLLFLALACYAICAPAKDLASYRNTNELVWDKAFNSSVAQFFGKLRASYFWRDGLVSQQISAGLGGSPDDMRRIDGTPLFLASACRHQSCPEKAAVVLGDPGRPIVFGLVHYSCFDRPAKAGCSEKPALLIFSKGSRVDPKVREAIVDWAERAVGDLGSVKTQIVR